MTDYDPPSMYSERMRVARKQHLCGECERDIEIGEKYQYVTGVWEGEFDTHRTCEHCVIGQKLLSKECGGWMFGMVGEDLQEHISEILPWSMKAARIVIGMDKKWKRFDGTALMALPII